MSDQSDTSASNRIDDCWNQIGVRGDGSCPKLPEHVHCRNCPVYSAAAIKLLNGDLPADQTDNWTKHYATNSGGEGSAAESAVVFRVGPEWFALATVNFKEVVPLRKTHPLPHRRKRSLLSSTPSVPDKPSNCCNDTLTSKDPRTLTKPNTI